MKYLRVAFVIAFIILMFSTGCTNTKDVTLQLYNFQDVNIPSPIKATLFRIDPVSGESHENDLNKTDIITVQRMLRSAADYSLLEGSSSVEQWDLAKSSSLLFEYEGTVEIELVVNNSLKTFKVEQACILVERDIILIKRAESVVELAGLQSSVLFRSIIKDYSSDSGFPLPPAKKENLKIDHLPLARPGGSRIEMLPPAIPPKKN